MHEVLSALPERERQLVALLWGVDGPRMSHDDVAAHFGLRVEMVRAIERAARGALELRPRHVRRTRSSTPAPVRAARRVGARRREPRRTVRTSRIRASVRAGPRRSGEPDPPIAVRGAA